jgi:hypothetical protein
LANGNNRFYDWLLTAESVLGKIVGIADGETIAGADSNGRDQIIRKERFSAEVFRNQRPVRASRIGRDPHESPDPMAGAYGELDAATYAVV